MQHKQAISSLRQVILNEIKIEESARGSMDEMSQSLGRMRMAYRQLSEQERNSKFGQELLKNIQTADSQIKHLDETIGNHQRNVGNYKSQWNGLNMSIQQVAREMPALAYGPKVFFSAISNNLPILADEIKRAKNEFKALKGEEIGDSCLETGCFFFIFLADCLDNWNHFTYCIWKGNC